jgi:ubiquitin-conjugating enzyme E2 Q
MPRKDLLADVFSCQAKRFANIEDLRYATDEGTFTFSYLSEFLPRGVVNIQVIVPEPFDYPKSHDYILFVGHDENVPPNFAAALEHVTSSVKGKSFSQLLETVSAALHRSLNYGTASDPIDLSEDTLNEEEVEVVEDLMTDPDQETGDSTDEDFGSDIDDVGDECFIPAYPTLHALTRTPKKSYSNLTKDSLHRIRSDLRAAKEAGFKVGILGDLHNGGFVCISIRVAKLGISEEAMQAWGLLRKHYLVLMIRFGDGYRTLQQVSELPGLAGRTEIRVGLCSRYKPSLQDALLAFTIAKDSQSTKTAAKDLVPEASSSHNPGNSSESKGAAIHAPSPHTLETLFIGRPLNDLLRTRFTAIVKYRLAFGFKWTGAEQFFNDNQGKSLTSNFEMDDKYYVSDEASNRALPSIVTADVFDDNIGDGELLSFPLVAMQFLLRHFVRCTEFCLVCHCRVGGTFEALRPYVCSKPLCLYQYMSLGFGPSIEWEILSQPYVVDLLVSFCYVSARHGRLKDFPTIIL